MGAGRNVRGAVCGLADVFGALQDRFYAVGVDISTGIFHSWDEIKHLVLNVKGAKYKGFRDLRDAEKYRYV